MKCWFSSFLNVLNFKLRSIPDECVLIIQCLYMVSIFPARSPVFKAMFATQMTESIRKVVEIEDFDEDIVRGMLEYIYTGVTQNLEENFMDLLRISDKYQVLGLKRKTEDIIMTKLNFENAGEILALSDFYSLESLKLKVINFMTQ